MLRGDERLGSAECSQLRKMQQEIASHGRDLDMDFDLAKVQPNCAPRPKTC